MIFATHCTRTGRVLIKLKSARFVLTRAHVGLEPKNNSDQDSRYTKHFKLISCALRNINAGKKGLHRTNYFTTTFDSSRNYLTQAVWTGPFVNEPAQFNSSSILLDLLKYSRKPDLFHEQRLIREGWINWKWVYQSAIKIIHCNCNTLCFLNVSSSFFSRRKHVLYSIKWEYTYLPVSGPSDNIHWRCVLPIIPSINYL